MIIATVFKNFFTFFIVLFIWFGLGVGGWGLDEFYKSKNQSITKIKILAAIMYKKTTSVDSAAHLRNSFNFILMG